MMGIQDFDGRQSKMCCVRASVLICKRWGHRPGAVVELLRCKIRKGFQVYTMNVVAYCKWARTLINIWSEKLFKTLVCVILQLCQLRALQRRVKVFCQLKSGPAWGMGWLTKLVASENFNVNYARCFMSNFNCDWVLGSKRLMDEV